MSAPKQTWWTTSELAAAHLPGLPTTRRGIDRIAVTEWRCQAEFARKRAGRGGGWEYHWQLLPLPARKHLLSEVTQPETPEEPRSREDIWAWFDGLKANVKAKAAKRLEILRAVETLRAGGTDAQPAVYEVAQSEGVGHATIFRWFAMVSGVDPSDWLAYLAPRHSASPGAPKAALDPRFFDLLKADYLRLERPSFSACYRRAARIARQNTWGVVPERLARRRMDALVPRVTQVLARQGVAGLERCYPPQRRDRSQMVALEGVNADCHKIDVFVAWPGSDKPVRPQIVAFQDIYSGKILSWRVDWSPNKVAVMAAFGDVIDTYGIPKHCLFDNGREFANKWMTGGAKTRFRFKIREDDPTGVLAQLGIETHWARPAHGQAKPIERAFRDFADDIARDPRFAGSYVGHKPEAKPENYASRSIPLDAFLAVVEDGIAEHNAREGRTSHTARGRSFDQTFDASYATCDVRKATEEQRRLWLMGQEVRKLHKTHGRLTLFENVYWSDWMNEHAGTDIVARFDPERLHDGVYIYAKDGRFLGVGDCEQRVGFFDLASARESAAKLARARKAHRTYLDTIGPNGVGDVATELDKLSPRISDTPDARVIRPEFGTRPGETAKRSARKAAPQDPNITQRHEALITKFLAPKRAETTTDTAQNVKHARFKRALQVEAALDRGDPVGDAEQQWLRSYQDLPEYKSLRRLHTDFGDAMFAS